MDGTALFSFYTLTPPLPVFTHLLGAWQTTQSSQLHWGYDSPQSSYTHRAQQTTVCIHPLGAWQTTQSSQTHLGHGTPQSAYTHWGHGRPHSLHNPTWGMAPHNLHTPTGAWQTTLSPYTPWGMADCSLHTPSGGMADHTVSQITVFHTPTRGMAHYTAFIYPLGAWQTRKFSPTHYGHGRPQPS